MKEQLVSFEVAELAKEKGFDWKTQSYYSYKKDLFVKFKPKLNDVILRPINHNAPKAQKTHSAPFASAPTQSLLQKWLRDEYKIHLTITSISQESWQYHITRVGDILGKNYKEDFYTYEEALEFGLQEALKLIK